MVIPTIWEKKNVPNHQPDTSFVTRRTMDDIARHDLWIFWCFDDSSGAQGFFWPTMLGFPRVKCSQSFLWYNFNIGIPATDQIRVNLCLLSIRKLVVQIPSNHIFSLPVLPYPSVVYIPAIKLTDHNQSIPQEEWYTNRLHLCRVIGSNDQAAIRESS